MFAAGKTATVSGGAPDDKFNYVTMLLHGDGTNGAQNNTFVDSSSNNFTITRNGNTTQGSFSPYGSNWANSFNGTNSYLTLSSNASMSFGTSNFTIEGWFFTGDKSISGGASRTLIGNSGNSYTEQLYISTSGYLTFGNTGSTFIQGSTDLANSTWHHFAVSRSGTSTNQIAMWVDGTRVAQGTNSQNYTSGTIYIGAFGTSDGFWNGYISNLRIVNGSAVYDPANSTITVPTTPLTAITNTALLTCQANRFFDASSNAYTVTATGTPSVQRFNPFGASTAYSTSVIGGSGYFDGNDYLNTPSTGQFTASGDFTVSCWFYLQSFSNAYYVVGGNWDGGASDEWLIQIQNNGAIRFLTSAGTSFSSSGVVKLNEWTYFTATRSGTTVTVQLNGTTVSTYTKSDTLGASSKTIYIGQQSGNNWPFNGYISDFRLLSGSAITTVPTSPVSSTSTGLLLSMTNGAIFDNAMMNDLETVGNAQISTSVKKFGTGSLAFDGTGDYLKVPASPNLIFGTGDFTIECWIYVSSNPAQYTAIVSNWAGADPAWILDFSNGSGNIRFNDNGNVYLTSSSTLTTGQWNHVAVSRSGTSLKMFFNGTSVATATNSTSFGSASAGVFVGAYYDGTYALNGYIDDLRITKGFARYTGNFTAPTRALSDTGPI